MRAQGAKARDDSAVDACAVTTVKVMMMVKNTMNARSKLKFHP